MHDIVRVTRYAYGTGNIIVPVPYVYRPVIIGTGYLPLPDSEKSMFIVRGVLCLVSRSKIVVKRQCLVGVQARTRVAKYY